jgi:hypothetical protein
MATQPIESVRPRLPGQESSAVQARQGVISGRVVLVLAASVSLAVIALLIVFFVAH